MPTPALTADGRVPINVEEYGIDIDTDEGKEEMSNLVFHLSGVYGTPIHFVFLRGGEEVGQAIIKSPFKDLQH
jgi:hypothetical protein